MKNWEEIYNSYKNGEMKEHYEELKAKADEKALGADSYKELQKMTKIMENLPKVENIMEYRSKLENDLEILKEEFVNSRQLGENIEKDQTKLEKEFNKTVQEQEKAILERKAITKRISEIDEKLKTEKETLTDDEKKSLKGEKEKLSNKKITIDQKLSDLRKKVDENNNSYSKNTESAEKIESREELKKYTKKEIREKCFKTSSMISKCNFIAGKLMEGQSRDSLEIALKNWKDRKFTSKTPLPITRKERTQKEQETKKIEKVEKTEDMPNKSKQNLVEVNEFEKQFPRLSKILPKFIKNSKMAKSIANWNKNRKANELDEEEFKESDLEPVDDLNDLRSAIDEYEKKNKREKFKEYLKYDANILDIAEKGINEVEKTMQKDKLKKTKEDAYKREEAKFGKDYAKIISYG